MDALLSEVKTLPLVKQRAVASFMGALVADAAGLSLLWVYKDEDVIKAVSADPSKPEFLVPSSNPYYRIPYGSQSHYGDHIPPVLRSIAQCKDFDPADCAEKLYQTFGPQSKYHREDTGKVTYPIDTGYSSNLVKRFLELFSQGKSVADITDDNLNNPDYIGRTIAPVLKWAGSPELQSKVEQSALLMQSNDMVLSIAGVTARLIEMYILDKGGDQGYLQTLVNTLKTAPDIPQDQRDLVPMIQEVIDAQNLSVKDATVKFGKACPLPGSFKSALRSLLDDTSYVSAAREVILAGGSSCSRLIFVGACLGAKYGIDGIPREWIDKTTAAEEALSLALQIVKT